MIAEITGQDFTDQVLRSELPVFACFVARWCHTCFPTCFVADELAEEYEGKIKFVRIDAEKNSEIRVKYHVIALPSIVLFQDSQPVNRLLGYQERASLRESLETLLAERQTSTGTLDRDDGKTKDDQSDSL
ncbi:MAG: thiol reductase thioredoxin [Chloroflexi bacterium]|nr:MAG: thiol reductase thioredoxin [Chloroflexota bacterium]